MFVSLWDCLPFSPSHSLIYPCPLPFKFLVFFFFISCCCIYVCICTYIYIPKYNLLKSCSVLLVCVFSGLTVWHWTINGCAPPWGGPPPAPSCPQLPIVLCVGLRPNGIIPIQFGTSIVSDFSALVWEVMLVRLYRHCFWCYWEIQPHSKVPFPLTLLIFQSLLLQCSLSLNAGMLCRFFHRDWALRLSILFGCGFL